MFSRALATLLVAVLSLHPAEALAERWSETTPTGVSLNDVTFLSVTRAVAVGNGGTILLSTDQGVSWADVSPGPADDLFSVVYSGSNVVAVGDNGRILHSGDSGANWADVSVATRTQALNSVRSRGSVFLAVGDGQTTGAPATRYFSAVRSTDGGATFAEVPTGNFPAITERDLLDVTFVTPAIMVAVGDRQGPNPTVLRSTDAGVTWTVPTLNNPPGRSLDVVRTVGDVVMAIGDRNGPTVAMYRSADQGATWDEPSSYPTGSPNNVSLVDMAVVSPTRFIAVGNAKQGNSGYNILITDDAGDTWTNAVVPPGSANLTAVAFRYQLGLAVGDNGTILSSITDGRRWTLDDTQGSTADLLDVAVINPAIAVGSGGQVLLRIPNTGEVTDTPTAGGILRTGMYEAEADTLDVPFEYEWVYGLVLLVLALMRLR